MSKVYWDYKKLNQEMEKIDQAGYQMPTRLYRVQEGRTDVVIQNDLKGAGLIRSYDEAKQFMERKFGDNFQGYTREEYNQQIKSLQDALGRERSYQGEVREQRSQLNNIVNDMNDELGTDINPSRLTTKDLYNATATLEAALLGCPEVAVYHLAFPHIMGLLRPIMFRTPWFTLVNIIARKTVIQELLAYLFTADNVADELRRILSDEAYKKDMLASYEHIRTILGDTPAAKGAAQRIVRLVRA